MRKKNITRREFVSTIAAGAGLIVAGRSAVAEPLTGKARSVDPFKIISLGKTGINTTLLGMGTGFNGGNRSSAITRAGNAESMIRYAFDKGIRFYDCADTYGTHPYVMKALKEIPREKYILGPFKIIPADPSGKATGDPEITIKPLEARFFLLEAEM